MPHAHSGTAGATLGRDASVTLSTEERRLRSRHAFRATGNRKIVAVPVTARLSGKLRFAWLDTAKPLERTNARCLNSFSLE